MVEPPASSSLAASRLLRPGFAMCWPIPPPPIGWPGPGSRRWPTTPGHGARSGSNGCSTKSSRTRDQRQSSHGVSRPPWRDAESAGPLRGPARRARAGRDLRLRRCRAGGRRPDALFPRRLPVDHLVEHQSRRAVRPQRQSLPRLRARLHLLLRAAHPRVPRACPPGSISRRASSSSRAPRSCCGPSCRADPGSPGCSR